MWKRKRKSAWKRKDRKREKMREKGKEGCVYVRRGKGRGRGRKEEVCGRGKREEEGIEEWMGWYVREEEIGEEKREKEKKKRRKDIFIEGR